ncbi:MAG TPA: YkgJ family cysteine cluster protein [Phycisphaerae bacterium]|nr:YkgJ family cysteine cluster protein [Phycisphaerae bacterium]HRW55894.1 YkgJ family cysteine cluster protein [Phycisphaerae bacterium]
MKLPVLIPDIRSQQWSCHSCTKCCRELIVHLTKADRERIDQQQWQSKLGVDPYVRLGRGVVLNHTTDGACVFLQADGKCRIHAELGMDAKPFACRIYPFTLEREGDAIRSALRFDCPSVTKSDGKPLQAYRRELQDLTHEIVGAAPSMFSSDAGTIAFSENLKIDAATLDRIVGRLDRWIADTQRPFNERVRGLLDIVTTLNEVNLSRFDGARLADLVSMLMDDMPATLDEFSEPVRDPTPRQLKLLRQAAFAHGSYVRFEEARQGFLGSIRFRFRQLGMARTMLAGTGPAPPFACDAIEATFEEIAAIRPLAPAEAPEADDLLTRYLTGRITNRGGFGRQYYGWPVLAGLNALLLSLAVVGWFARRAAAGGGRDFLSIDDVRTALMIVDRTAGRSPELGARSGRLRLRYLAQESGFGRLIARYGVIPAPSPTGADAEP